MDVENSDSKENQKNELLAINDIPTALEVAFGYQGMRSISVDRLPDEANPRSQQRGGFKDEGYTQRLNQR